jgi:NAD(P)-dependent dehydrogenase (short-subunit alcohol dehydrogenase family)
MTTAVPTLADGAQRTGRFDRRVVWITGAGSGIGAACVEEFARRGAWVALSGRRREPLERAAETVRALGQRALVLPVDVTEDGAQEGVVETIVEEFGRLDVALANAGYAVSGRILDVPAAQWRRQLDVNVHGLLGTARAAFPALRQTGGRIALVGSVAAWMPLAGSGPYTTSKAAVRMIGDTLAIELQGTGVSCTTIHPGFVESDIARVDNDGTLHPQRRDHRPSRLMWTAPAAARVMVDAIARRQQQFVFTTHGRIGVAIGQYLPGITRALLGWSARRSAGREG